MSNLGHELLHLSHSRHKLWLHCHQLLLHASNLLSTASQFLQPNIVTLATSYIGLTLCFQQGLQGRQQLKV